MAAVVLSRAGGGFLGVLWLQQHGYLQVPITVCDWASVGK
jgi:hypothetical protein